MGKKRSAIQGFVRDYTAGLRREEFRRLFREDAVEAYAVLTRDREDADEPAGRVRRFFYRARILFLGISEKLAPARRILFALSLLCVVLALAECRLDVGSSTEGGRLLVEASPLWWLTAFGALLFLFIVEQVDRVRVRDELEVARLVQRDLLPEAFPGVAGYAFAHSYRTAREVGGDYYDLIPLPDGRLVLLSGDASGHGMAAGLLMAIANATIQTAVATDPEPRSVALALNRTLCCTGGQRAFMTLFYGLLDPASGRLDYVCAGHPFPLLVRPGRQVIELGKGGLPLGLRTGLEITAARADLEAGDHLVLYTDGLPEALDRRGEAFGFERLRDLVAAGGGAQRVHDGVLVAFERHLGGADLADDVSLVVVERSRTPQRS
ncbi:MAG: PP2C family protein-serine/threonine phosphatase [Acidobacteriota bacterium]